MIDQRHMLTFSTILFIAGMVIVVAMIASPMTVAALPYNETAVEERLDNIEKMLEEMKDTIDGIEYGIWGTKGAPSPVISEPPITTEPITNETDVIILPEPVTNETDVVIIVTDPLEELKLSIEFLGTNLHDLRMELSSLQSVDRANDAKIEKLNSKIDSMETTLNEQVEYLENKISGLQNTILWLCVGTVVILILFIVVIYLFKKGVFG